MNKPNLRTRPAAVSDGATSRPGRRGRVTTASAAEAMPAWFSLRQSGSAEAETVEDFPSPRSTSEDQRLETHVTNINASARLQVIEDDSGESVAATNRPASSTRAEAMPRWLSVRQIAEDLDVSVHTVYKWSARGEPWFPHSVRLNNRDLRVRRDWYEAWLATMEQRR